MNSNHELAEYIASHLPISFEDALDFVEGSLSGGMFTDKINFTIALGNRDRVIMQMSNQLNAIRSLLEKYNI
ncbi:hypothetical protein M5X02_31525 [Paenibacillus alvei]|uniref:hypothetical protein n=1 Tax=Paenibacillus alvei TaxID=44250 RepID=UPI00028925BD|nr:hypothetical protein [Paenibacillus alvei]EJW13959.1 hypothetical protein PAV_141p00650 [Paenibacillus alvei DSM 29]MCY9545159.1 hypothetical protein [Paenibacillus alvei]MCY9707678.1 hypothetical protein [Paenibacillus alvei]MEC0082809.1 hypothetical protein [Paenibacillus alvei]